MKPTLIHGENAYIASQTYNEIVSRASSNIRIIDGQTTEVNEVLEALGEQSLFSTGEEQVLIKNPSKNKKVSEVLTKIIEDGSLKTKLVVFELDIDKRSKLYKVLKKNADVTNCINLSESALISWIIDYSNKRKASIERGVASRIADELKGNQLKIVTELDKLIAYDKRITLESVGLLIGKTPDDNIFELLNFIATSQKVKALTKYDELIDAQVDPHYILVMLSWQMSNALSIKSAGSLSDKEITNLTGINPYTISKTRQITSKFSLVQLNEMALNILETDRKLKTISLNVEQTVRALISKL